MYFEVLRIPLGAGFVLLLEDNLTRESKGELKRYDSLPSGWFASMGSRSITAPSPSARPAFAYDPMASERGLAPLRLFELREYWWTLSSATSRDVTTVRITSGLASASKGDSRWIDRDTNGTFTFVNYLGSGTINATLPDGSRFTLEFEVASPKLSYEEEYRGMLESIGAECQQLLLDWGTPTSLTFSPNPESINETILEQFLFLRDVISPNKLDLYLELISRRPHSRLIRELEWKPVSVARPEQFLSDPFRYGRDWFSTEVGFRPSEIHESRKFETLDTPPNRFVKFALLSFVEVCTSIISASTDGRRFLEPRNTLLIEARAMIRTLETLLNDSFFYGVGALNRIPLENTTLQKRDGYRQILLAWLLLDAAAKLNWPGRRDVYEGSSRKVPDLYEYWLYFLLVRAFKTQLRMTPERDPLSRSVDGALPFCCRSTDGRLLINLKKGAASFARFKWTDGVHQLRVHFYYNRSFGRSAVGTRGTYSKTFRPDFSLVVLPDDDSQPDWETAEREAERLGTISYLHFDAKYRGENLSSLFGLLIDSDEAEIEIRNVPLARAKDEDIYKMHTYNDAIRRTVGSYVLYPGIRSDADTGDEWFPRYHELVPGIGAFALRPTATGDAGGGLLPLCEFLEDFLRHQSSQFTQSHRVDYWTTSTVREDTAHYSARSVDLPQSGKPPKDTNVVLGWVRDEAQGENCRRTQSFVCHAVEWATGDEHRKPGRPTQLLFDPYAADFLIVFNANKSMEWYATVNTVALISADQRASEIGSEESLMGAAYYYRFSLSDIQSMRVRDVRDLVWRRPSKPIVCRLSEFSLLPIIGEEA
jgi:predicted component of viral defense system (DUF524 family)